jgi:hypothetical protein
MRRCVLKAFAEAKGDREKVAEIIGRHPTNLPKLLGRLGLEHLKGRGKSPL